MIFCPYAETVIENKKDAKKGYFEKIED